MAPPRIDTDSRLPGWARAQRGEVDLGGASSALRGKTLVIAARPAACSIRRAREALFRSETTSSLVGAGFDSSRPARVKEGLKRADGK